MALNQVGVNSLLAVNQWVGLINSNLISASRTGYKTSRISFSDGLGSNRVTDDIFFPPATLSVQATTIEWEQGSIINSTSQTHFAIQGEGFFVLHDPRSDKYFLSRDGEFHWGDNGYLVNSSGLRVVSSGQDYIQRGGADASDQFSPDGYSRELITHGDKSFLLIDVLNRDNLRMSQFGSTVFELDGAITTRLDNDFDSTTDGVTFVYDDPTIVPIVNDPGFITAPVGAATNFTINFGANGVFDWQADSGLGAFDVTTLTIQDIVDGINTWGATVFGVGQVVASFDLLRDRLIIENRVDVTNPAGTGNGVNFGGPNGTAVRDFFRLNNDPGFTDELATPAFESTIIESDGDIDNSHLAEFKDLGYPGFFAGPVRPQIDISVATLNQLTNPKQIYTHTKGVGGFIESEALGGNSMILGETAQTDEFDIVMDVKISNTNRAGGPTATADALGNAVDGLMIFAFGQDDAHSLQSGGFELIYNSSLTPIPLTSSVTFPTPFPVLQPGQVVLRAKPGNYNEEALSPHVGGPIQQLPTIGRAYNPVTGLSTFAADRIAIKLDGDRKLTISIVDNTGLTTGVATFDLSGGGQEIGGHITLRNSLNLLQVHKLHMDFKRSANAVTTGEMVAVNLPPYASVDRGEHGNRPRSRIIQASLETSNASLTEYVPMLSLAQKVFSAVSKIISVYNSTIDDMNSTIR